MALPNLQSQYGLDRTGVYIVDKYDAMFADMPDEVGTREALTILDVASIQGVHYILNHLPEDAPIPKIREIVLGSRRMLRFQKQDLIELRRYRDSQEH